MLQYIFEIVNSGDPLIGIDRNGVRTNRVDKCQWRARSVTKSSVSFRHERRIRNVNCRSRWPFQTVIP